MSTANSTLARFNPLPGWALWWFYISVPVVTWDAFFILNRPASMPGGSLHWLWLPYKKYITVDLLYGDIQNGFVFAQGCMNLVEAAIACYGCYLHYRRNPAAVVYIFTSALMTFSKTILYFGCEAASGFAHTAHNDWATLVVFYVLPNIFWIIFPGFIVFETGKRILGRFSSGQ